MYNASIIAVTETWLADDIVHYYTYSDYQQFSQCRKGRSGGGVTIFFDPSYSVLQVPVLLPPPDSCNLLPVVDVTSGHCWILVYRLLDTFANDSRLLFAMINEILNTHAHVSTLGDLNLHIDWSVTYVFG